MWLSCMISFAILILITDSSKYCTPNDSTDSINYLYFNKNQDSSCKTNISLIVNPYNLNGLLLLIKRFNSQDIQVEFKDVGQKNLRFSFINGTNSYSKMLGLKKLCKCRICQYEHLLLEFSIKNKIFTVRCNKGESATIEVKESLIKDNNMSVWLVNLKTMHYSDNLFACFYNISCDGQRIFVTESNLIQYDKDIFNCPTSMCNGGTCLETSRENICDCSETIFNGKVCNLSYNGFENDIKPLQCEILKLSWINKLKKSTWIQIGSENFLLHVNKISIILKNKAKEIKISNNNYYENFEYILLFYISIDQIKIELINKNNSKINIIYEKEINNENNEAININILLTDKNIHIGCKDKSNKINYQPLKSEINSNEENNLISDKPKTFKPFLGKNIQKQSSLKSWTIMIIFSIMLSIVIVVIILMVIIKIISYCSMNKQNWRNIARESQINVTSEL